MRRHPYPKPPHLPSDFVTCVPWAQLEERWGKRESKRFSKWMWGQTCLMEGAYLHDVQLYVEQRNRGVKDPHVWD